MSRLGNLKEVNPRLYLLLHDALDWWIENADVKMEFSSNQTGGGEMRGPGIRISRADTERFWHTDPLVSGMDHMRQRLNVAAAGVRP